MPYVVKLVHFAAIHLKGSPFAVQNGQSFLIFGDSSSVTSHNVYSDLRYIVFNFLLKYTKTTKHSLKGEHDTFIIVRRYHKAANRVEK